MPGPRWQGSSVLNIVAPEKSVTPLALKSEKLKLLDPRPHSPNTGYLAQHQHRPLRRGSALGPLAMARPSFYVIVAASLASLDVRFSLHKKT